MTFKNKVKIKLSKYFRKFLTIYFKFDNWHLGDLNQRAYAIDIINYINNQNHHSKKKLLEIGCGLGDIISNIHHTERTGLDIDKNVLKASQFKAKLLKQKIKFKQFDLQASKLDGLYDTIIMVNWIHNIEPKILQRKVTLIFQHNLNKNGLLIFDTVSSPDYKYNHTVGHLTTRLQCSTKELGQYERGRKVYIITKN